MIRKFREINNLAVFQNFNWDTTVVEEHGIKEFKKVNILYGRNYSGKTTLSRILRAMETNNLSEKYEEPSFRVSLRDGEEITPSNLNEHSETIRVFNEDFVKDNLKFIINPEDDIKPFAIVGEDNNEIEKEIRSIKSEIGSNKHEEETGLYKKSKVAEENFRVISSEYEDIEQELNTQLRTKATDRKTGIKYNSDKFGDQNYDIRDLKKDIKTVLHEKFQPIDNEEKREKEKLIEEETLDQIPELSTLVTNFKNYSDRTKGLIEREVAESGKIKELAKDALLNKWVKEGHKLHKNKRTNCAFCGNNINENRWEKLERHFDEESEKLEKEIDNLIGDIEKEIENVSNAYVLNKNLFYTTFHSEIERLIESYSASSKKYCESLNSLIDQLKQKKIEIINVSSYEMPEDSSSDLLKHWQKYDLIREKSNKLSETLNEKQSTAKQILRLREVSDFLDTINYESKKSKLANLKTKVDESREEKERINSVIKAKEDLVESKKRELNDEEVGAKKVNEYLKKFFGNDFLYLKAVEKEKTDQKEIFFEVLRDEKIAYNLSQGECNLLAFCYFIAKLEETETADTNPVIWIDDPISSLDSNHIFFVYSLIKSKIVDSGSFQQLFISTHNLNFLKYLKRLNDGYDRGFFLINRIGKISNILPMPKYMRKYFTEFNYLFEQIYKCSNIEKIDDSNHKLFYSFGNNARKFLEIYLYYKYPDTSKNDEKLKKFFGEDDIPMILTNRLSNEYSHLSGVFERGATPVEVPEIKLVAEKIIDKLKEDEDQYKSLLKSIGQNTG